MAEPLRLTNDPRGHHLTVRQILVEPCFAAGEPLVHAGRINLDNEVSWVHTSEVLDISHLLRGQEFLLVGGVILAQSAPEARAAYVRALSARGVAGLGVETGTTLGSLPEDMVAEADRLRFPLIELRKVVRFVEVSQTLNSRLVNQSIRDYQVAERLSHELARALADDADAQRLLDVMGVMIGGHLELRSTSGHLIAEGGQSSGSGDTSSAEAWVPVAMGDVTTALLTLTYPAGTDPALIQGLLKRAPDVLGLTLLRWQQPSDFERATQQLFTALEQDQPTPAITDLARRLRIDRHDAWLCLAADLSSKGRHVTRLVQALRESGWIVVSSLTGDRLVALLAFDLRGQTAMQARGDFLERLKGVAPPSCVVAVGPAVNDLRKAGRSLASAKETLAVAPWHPEGPVVDALDFGVPRLAAAMDSPKHVADFIVEQIGDLLAYDESKGTGGVLFETLVAHLKYQGRKTETAEALHIHRQSLYQRLERVFDLLGNPEDGGDRWASIMVAVQLERARRLGLSGT